MQGITSQGPLCQPDSPAAGRGPAAALLPALWPALALALVLAAVLLSAVPGRADEELDYGLASHRLHQIRLAGNTTFGDDELKSVLRFQEPTWKRPLEVPRYQPHLVQTQLRLLTNYYRNRGFHAVSVTLDSIGSVPEQGDVLYISIVEGIRTFIRRVEFTGAGPLDPEDLRRVLTLRAGVPAPADLTAFGGDIYAIVGLYRDAAYLDAMVVVGITPVAQDWENGSLSDVQYRIEPGRPYTVRHIILVGNEHTHDNLLTRELKIAPGDPIQWERGVEFSRRQLLGTSLFRDVSIVPVAVDTATGLADLEVRVVERKPAYYELGVGMGSLERIRLLAAWGHHNLWGTGRRLQVRGRGSWNLEDVVGNPIAFDEGQINYQADVTYVNPHLRDSRYSFDLDFYLKRITRGESGLNMAIHGFNVGTSWRASPSVTNNVFLGLKITDPSVHPQASPDIKERFLEAGVALSQTRSLNWGLYIDTRDDVFRPAAGLAAAANLQLTGGLMGGDYSFFKWTTSWQNYHRLPVGGVLALRAMLGGARPYGQSLGLGPDGVPYDDRFFAGGGSSVRGYRHNSLGPQVSDPEELDYLNYTSDVLLPDNPARGGNYLMLTNLEWRFPLPLLKRWKLASVLFFEGGNVWERISDLRMLGFRLNSEPGDPNDPGSTKVWDYRYSYGTGLRLDTPIGPVRVDVGVPLKRARYKGVQKDETDPKTVWHFSLGYPF